MLTPMLKQERLAISRTKPFDHLGSHLSADSPHSFLLLPTVPLPQEGGP